MTIGIEGCNRRFANVSFGIVHSLASLMMLSPLFAAGDLHKPPLAFEKNQGQVRQSVDFLARGGGYNVFLSHGNVRLELRQDKSAAPVAVDLRFVGANRDVKAATRVALP